MIWIPVAVAFSAALILQDCILLSAGAIASVRGFYCSMDRAAPLTPFSAAVRCVGAGLTLPLLGLAIMLVSTTALLGWWSPSPRSSAWAVMVVLLTVGLPLLLRLIVGSAEGYQVIIDVLAMAALLIVIEIRGAGISTAACWALLASSAIVLGVSWNIAHTTANTLLDQARS